LITIICGSLAKTYLRQRKMVLEMKATRESIHDPSVNFRLQL